MATKKRNSEQVGLGLAAAASPPLEATNPGADRSTSSIGSWHQASRSSPSDLQQFVNDPANQPLSLDAEVNNKGATTTKDLGTEQPERRSLFGKFKAKVGLSRENRDGGGGSSERTKSPVTSEGPGRSGSSLALSPPPTSREPMGRSTPAEGARTSEEPVQSPVSPQLGGSMPPAIPEEPLSPESPVTATAAATSASKAGPVPETAPESAVESAPAVEQAAPESAESAPATESAAAPESASVAEPADPPTK